MKKIITALMLLCSTSARIISCPTCVGRVTQDSPPFFSEEFYRQQLQTSHDTTENKKDDTKDLS